MSYLRRLLAVSAVVSVMISGPHGLAADGADASQSPRTSGPLVGLFLSCPDNGAAGPNETRGQSCSWLYDLLPAETNATEDFSAYWVQIEIDPGKGMCAKMIDFELQVSEDRRIVSAVPDKSTLTKKAKPSVTKLIVDGGGTAPIPGTVEQDVSTPVGRTRVWSGDHRYRLRWTGNSRDKIMIAIGVQLAHVSAPPEFAYSWSESYGMGMGSCRIYTIRLSE